MAKSYSSARNPPVRAGLVRDRRFDRVGVLYPHYGLEKVSYALPVKDFTFVTVKALPLHRYLDRRGTFWAYTPFVVDRSLGLIHTFNALPANSRRFVVSFEMELPRYLGRCTPMQSKVGWRILRSDRCRAILALSEAAGAFFERRLGPDDLALGAKLSVFRGGMDTGLAASVAREWRQDGPVKVLFVGGDARRKGLVPLLRALKRLRRGGADFQLTVVSSIEEHTYVFSDDLFPAASLKREMQELPWVTHHPYLENARVRELMRASDLFALPTLDESLGWSLIEAGVERLPLVSTNIFAIPELLRDGVGGRLIALGLNEDRRWDGIYLNDAERNQSAIDAFARIEEALVEVLGAAHADRSMLATWSHGSHEHLCGLYDERGAAETLTAIYRKALA